MTLSELLQRRLVVVLGKGGAGKSTVTAALAVLAARHGKRTLVLGLAGAEPLGALLGAARLTPDIRQLRPNLWGAHVQAEDALVEYGVSVLRWRALYRYVFENKLVSQFLHATPGLRELLVIGKVRFHVEDEALASGEPRWPIVMADCPPTGASLHLLQLPSLMASAFTSGPLAYFARKQRDLLRDHLRAAAVVVTLPEELSARESLDIASSLRALDIELGAWVVNRVVTPLYDEREAEDLERLCPFEEENAQLRALCAAGRDRQSVARCQRRHVDTLHRAIGGRHAELPLIGTALGPADVERLADHLERDLALSP